MNEQDHPLDGALGDIHEIALILESQGQTPLALKLAIAHEKITIHLLGEMCDAAERSLLASLV